MWHAPQVAGVIHAAAVGVSERPFVKAKELNGVRPWRIMLSDILPNLITPIVVAAGLALAVSVSAVLVLLVLLTLFGGTHSGHGGRLTILVSPGAAPSRLPRGSPRRPGPSPTAAGGPTPASLWSGCP